MRSPITGSAVTRRARPLLAASILLAVSLVAACVPTGERPTLTDEAIDQVAPPAGTPSCPDPAEPFEAFGSTVVRLMRAEGPLERCVLVADTLALRSQGLMGVTDLAGFDGMLFAFPDDTLGGFWMANTLIPLTIAFVDAGGAVTTLLDMAPCPEGDDCPTYEPGGPYRWALEVPQGAVAGFGAVPGTLFDLDTLPQASQ